MTHTPNPAAEALIQEFMPMASEHFEKDGVLYYCEQKDDDGDTLWSKTYHATKRANAIRCAMKQVDVEQKIIQKQKDRILIERKLETLDKPTYFHFWHQLQNDKIELDQVREYLQSELNKLTA